MPSAPSRAFSSACPYPPTPEERFRFMFGSLPQPAYLPCPMCGASVARGLQDEHECDEAQRLSYELLQIRLESDRFDLELERWLGSPAGRFAEYYAARQRRPAA
jgi:hypothetical protein